MFAEGAVKTKLETDRLLSTTQVLDDSIFDAVWIHAVFNMHGGKVR